MKRKDFIIKTSGLILSAVSANKILANIKLTKSVNSKINVGIIGSGSRGQGIIKLLNEQNGYNVLGVCDNIPFRLNEGRKLNNNRKVKPYSDYRNLIENKEIDAVIICTPLNTHAQIAIDALDSEKHVYCEKTLAKGINDTNRIVKKCKNSNKIFQTGHQFHSSRMYKQLVDIILDGKVGSIISIEAQWNRNGNWRKTVNNPLHERQINWRMYREYSYGLLARGENN